MTDIVSLNEALRGTDVVGEARTAVQRTVDYIVATAEYSRDDRLWPSDAHVFATNPLSVAYGACGTALFLATVDVPDALSRVADWILRHPITVRDYPPGLYLGLAGIAYTLHEVGVREEAVQVMHELFRSPLTYAEPDMLHGVAGWGWASLYFFDATGDELHLDRAIRAGEHLLRTAEPERDSCFWRCQADGLVHYGFGHGASGISLFLAYLYRPHWRRSLPGRRDEGPGL